ncbi:hypothetical protein ABZU32_08795 [Sphaerisporangium sp. NPDC005288]|uniref:hypothetical protein n=1 Tax=Sphaerisporangium sp. NPDC005288 TaxID=3155114 RepID=UPI0033A40F67
MLRRYVKTSRDFFYQNLHIIQDAYFRLTDDPGSISQPSWLDKGSQRIKSLGGVLREAPSRVPWKSKVYASLSSAIIVLLALGFGAYGLEFSSNLLGEGAGILASVIIGFALVDKLIETESRLKWGRVRRYTIRAVEFRLNEMFFLVQLSNPGTDYEKASESMGAEIREYVSYLNSSRADESYRPESRREVVIEDASQDPLGLARPGDLFSYRSEPSGNGGTIYFVPNEEVANKLHQQWLNEDSSRVKFQSILPHVEYLRDVVTPRIIDFGYEPRLIEILVSLEEAHNHWGSLIDYIEDDWGMPDYFAWEAAVAFFEQCAVLADHIAQYNGEIN